MIMAGRATLHPRQDEPPWVLLSEAQKALSAVDRIGPSATTEALERISADLLPSGVRQTTLHGAHVSWAHSSSKGEVAFRKALLGPVGPVPGLSRQISDALAYRLAQKKPVTLTHRPSTQEIETLGIIDVPDREEPDWAVEWRCYEIGRDWLAFRNACLVLSGELDGALETALREGRMLVVEELFPGGRLLHPDRWKEEKYDPTDFPNDWFLLTRDLPGEWFSSKATKLGRPRGRGGYAAKDAPFVDVILERLDESEGLTVHGAVVDLVDQHGDEIPGASHEAKVSRLMKRVRDLRS